MNEIDSDYPFEVLQPLPVDPDTGETVPRDSNVLDLTVEPTTEMAFDDDLEDPLDADPYRVPEVEGLLNQAIDQIADARTTPMSATVKVNRDEILDLLEDARDALPEELRAARWLLKEKESFLERARQEREDILDQGRIEVGRMVERQEIVRQAEAKARQITEDARADARTLQRQMEDFCDQKLAAFEVLIERTDRTVRKGRQQLLGSANLEAESETLAPPPPAPTTSKKSRRGSSIFDA